MIFGYIRELFIIEYPSLLCCRAVIQFVNNQAEPDWRGYAYAVIMLAFAILQSAILHQYFLKAMLVGMRLRSTICSSVYNKVSWNHKICVVWDM